MSLRASSLDWGCPPKSTDFRWLKRVVEGHIGHGPKRHWRTLHGFFSTDDIPHFTCLKFSRPHTSSGGHVQSFSQRTDQGSTSNVHECVHIWRCSAPCVHEFSHTGQRSPASVHKCVHHDRCSTSSVHEADHNGKRHSPSGIYDVRCSHLPIFDVMQERMNFSITADIHIEAYEDFANW